SGRNPLYADAALPAPRRQSPGGGSNVRLPGVPRFFCYGMAERSEAPISRVAPIKKPFAMTEHRVSYTLDSTLETVESAEHAAGKVATEAGIDEDEVMRISMAVREAAVNAVLHGNAYDPGKKVSLVLERTAV